MSILLLSSFILIVAALMIRDKKISREIVIKGFLVLFLFILTSTEVLSLFRRIDYGWILVSWLIFNIFLLLFLVWNINKRSSNLKDIFPNLKFKSKSKIRSISGLSFLIILVVSGITLFIALNSPPNNFDSMTYHMARVPHWIQNRSINYYPTSIPRQNYSQPLAEYAILQLQILSKGDQFANLVQWFSFILGIIGTTLIAKELNLSKKSQWISGVIAATLPMAILQSTSTQNDLLVSTLIISFFYFLFVAARDLSWEDFLYSGIAMGLALAAKGTAYIYCAAIGMGVGLISLSGLKFKEIKQVVPKFTVVVLLGIILNTGIYFRNWNLYRHPILTSNQRTIVEAVNPSIFGANLIRNSLVHLASPLESANDWIEERAHRLLGSEIKNPASTFQNSDFEISFSLNEDEAGNGLHLIGIASALIILPWTRANNKKELFQYLSSISLGIIFFSLVFKWQPWGGRLQTPLFLLGCAGIAGLTERVKFRKFGSVSFLIIFMLFSTPYLLLNFNRPVIPLWEDKSVFYDTKLERSLYSSLGEMINPYPALKKRISSALSILYEGRSILHTSQKELIFLSEIEVLWPYASACHRVRNTISDEVGLIMDSNDWEYPIWVFLNQQAPNNQRYIYHIDVNDISSNLASEYNARPDVILVTRDNYSNPDLLDEYDLTFDSEFIQVYENKNNH